jgi:hypothetical protein
MTETATKCFMVFSQTPLGPCGLGPPASCVRRFLLQQTRDPTHFVSAARGAPAGLEAAWITRSGERGALGLEGGAHSTRGGDEGTRARDIATAALIPGFLEIPALPVQSAWF